MRVARARVTILRLPVLEDVAARVLGGALDPARLARDPDQ
jgi:hypothetical protein